MAAITGGMLDSIQGQGSGTGLNPTSMMGKGVQGSMFSAALGSMPGLLQGAMGSVNPGQIFKPVGVMHSVGQGGLVGVMGAKEAAGMAA